MFYKIGWIKCFINMRCFRVLLNYYPKGIVCMCNICVLYTQIPWKYIFFYNRIIRQVVKYCVCPTKRPAAKRTYIIKGAHFFYSTMCVPCVWKTTLMYVYACVVCCKFCPWHILFKHFCAARGASFVARRIDATSTCIARRALSIKFLCE